MMVPSMRDVAHYLKQVKFASSPPPLQNSSFICFGVLMPSFNRSFQDSLQQENTVQISKTNHSSPNKSTTIYLQDQGAVTYGLFKVFVL